MIWRKERDAVGTGAEKAKLTRLWAVFFFSKLSFLSMKVALLSFTKLRFWTSSSTRFWISEMLKTGRGTCRRNSAVFSDTQSHWALTLPGSWWQRAWKTVPQRKNLGNLRASIKIWSHTTWHGYFPFLRFKKKDPGVEFRRCGVSSPTGGTAGVCREWGYHKKHV